MTTERKEILRIIEIIEVAKQKKIKFVYQLDYENGAKMRDIERMCRIRIQEINSDMAATRTVLFEKTINEKYDKDDYERYDFDIKDYEDFKL